MNRTTTARRGGLHRLASAGLVLTICGCAATAPVDSPDYVPGAGYHMVMAEIAAQRGRYPTAAEEYLEGAERSDDPELAQRATAFAFEFGFDDIALRAARRWAHLEPDNASAQLYIARLLVRRGDIGGATDAARRALGGESPDSAADYLLLAGELGQEANAEGVTRVLTRLAAQAPRSAEMDLAVARAALRSGDLELALESAYAVQAAPDAEDFLADASLLVGRVLLAQGRDSAALEYMARLVESEPSLEFALENARFLAAAQRPAESLQELDALTERFGERPDIERLRALVYFDAGDNEAAWDVFGRLLREGVFVEEALFYLGAISEREGRSRQAAELFSRVPDGSYLMPAQIALTRLIELSEGDEAALGQLEEFARAYPRLGVEAERLRAAVLQRAGRKAEAREAISQALRYRSADVDLLLARGTLLEQMDDLPAALADLRQAVDLAPDGALALNAYGYTLANRTSRLAEAHQLIRRALERDPDNAAILDSYGWVLFREGRLAEARSYLQLAYSGLPDPEVAAHLGEVLWQQGERDRARNLWEEAAERAPDNEALRETMGRHLD
ncbi:MAG: tetratricopeptide repeat protein [Gammaproteobacteria bacterium]|nr:tetratricopeptide repeat protein [Gammaproteobacteria bacterium]